MSRFALTDEFTRLLRQPIVERAQNVMLRCPFHMDDRPSMSVDLDRGLWVCFGCGEKGSVFSLARRLEQPLDETAVLLRAYEAVASSQEYEEPPDFTEQAEEYHARAEREITREVVEYMVKRPIAGRAFKHFKLGWTGRAISIPYYLDEKVIGIKYRAPDGFKWSETGSRRYVYNINDTRDKDVVILCEGESDTHSVWSQLDRSNPVWHNVGVAGVPGVGKGQPSRGTWELWSLELMWAKRIFIAFDADDAGDEGSVIPLSLFGEKAVRLRPTHGKDMSEHLMKGGTLEGLGLDEQALSLS